MFRVLSLKVCLAVLSVASGTAYVETLTSRPVQRDLSYQLEVTPDGKEYLVTVDSVIDGTFLFPVEKDNLNVPTVKDELTGYVYVAYYDTSRDKVQIKQIYTDKDDNKLVKDTNSASGYSNIAVLNHGKIVFSDYYPSTTNTANSINIVPMTRTITKIMISDSMGSQYLVNTDIFTSKVYKFTVRNDSDQALPTVYDELTGYAYLAVKNPSGAAVKLYRLEKDSDNNYIAVHPDTGTKSYVKVVVTNGELNFNEILETGSKEKKTDTSKFPGVTWN